MVATRIVIVIGILGLLLALGADWIQVGSSQSAVPNGYTSFDVASMMGGYIRGQQTSSYNYSQSADFGAYIVSTLPSLLAGSWESDAALAAVPLGLVFALAAFSRWRLSVIAGSLTVGGSALWILGMYQVAPVAVEQLAKWQGFRGTVPQVTLSASVGPYIALVSGVVLLYAYYFTRIDKLDRPTN